MARLNITVSDAVYKDVAAFPKNMRGKVVQRALYRFFESDEGRSLLAFINNEKLSFSGGEVSSAAGTVSGGAEVPPDDKLITPEDDDFLSEFFQK